jgi:hypothetical protein
MKAITQSSTTDGLAETILQAIRGLKYGSLEIIVHDAKVVRIERHERIRLDVDPESALEQNQAPQHR